MRRAAAPRSATARPLEGTPHSCRDRLECAGVGMGGHASRRRVFTVRPLPELVKYGENKRKIAKEYNRQIRENWRLDCCVSALCSDVASAATAYCRIWLVLRSSTLAGAGLDAIAFVACPYGKDVRCSLRRGWPGTNHAGKPAGRSFMLPVRLSAAPAWRLSFASREAIGKEVR